MKIIPTLLPRKEGAKSYPLPHPCLGDIYSTSSSAAIPPGYNIKIKLQKLIIASKTDRCVTSLANKERERGKRPKQPPTCLI